MKFDWKKDENVAWEWNYTSGKWNGDSNDKGTFYLMFLQVGSFLVLC